VAEQISRRVEVLRWFSPDGDEEPSKAGKE
jgi:hypothetical protein